MPPESPPRFSQTRHRRKSTDPSAARVPCTSWYPRSIEIGQVFLCKETIPQIHPATLYPVETYTRLKSGVQPAASTAGRRNRKLPFRLLSLLAPTCYHPACLTEGNVYPDRHIVKSKTFARRGHTTWRHRQTQEPHTPIPPHPAPAFGCHCTLLSRTPDEPHSRPQPAR